jgi:hypothetical protein
LSAREAGGGLLDVLVGTGSSEIRRLSLDCRDLDDVRLLPAGPSGRVLVRGHGYGERAVRGLCCSAHCGEIYSVGGDGFLRVWDGDRAVCLAAPPLGEGAGAVDCSPLSARPEQLVVGLWAGGIVVLDLESLRRRWVAGRDEPALGGVVLARLGERRGGVREVKYAPDGSLVAAGTATEGVHIYTTGAAFGWRGVCKTQRMGAIMRLDWSECGR